MGASHRQQALTDPNTKAFLDNGVAIVNLREKLRAIKDQDYLDGLEAQAMGIEFSSLDILDGKTSQSATSFFHPDLSYEVANSGVAFDAFSKYPDEGTSRIHSNPHVLEMFGERGIAWNRFNVLIHAFMAYRKELCTKFEYATHSIWGAQGKQGEIGAIYRGTYSTSPKCIEQCNDDQRSHRMIVMASSNPVDGDRITVSEIEMLVSWMRGAMIEQGSAIDRHGVLPQLHLVFPVLAISFLMPTHARIIQGYFHDGKLRIQLTKHCDFELPHNMESMNKILRWAGAVPQGDTLADKILGKGKGKGAATAQSPVKRQEQDKNAPRVMAGIVPRQQSSKSSSTQQPSQHDLPRRRPRYGGAPPPSGKEN